MSGGLNLVVHRRIAYRAHVAKRDWDVAGWSAQKASARNAMKRFSVICSRCGLSVNRLIDAETAQTEIYPVPYQEMQDRTQRGRFRLSGIRTRRRKIETLGPGFPDRRFTIRELNPACRMNVGDRADEEGTPFA
jgi:hypothetical protein